MADDAERIYEWVREGPGKAGKVFLYGHSLGCAVAAKLVERRGGEGRIKGVVLDSPFVNATSAALWHPSTTLLRWLVPGAGWLIGRR